jgi:virginiamycin B lyase
MGPVGITVGPDRALWFAGYTSNEIGRLTPTGELSRYPVPTAESRPYHLVTGPDGALWFTEIQGNKIGRLRLQ